MLPHRLYNKIIRNENGFTLLELLVSIIIVGVLSSIALPSFLSQVGRARSSEAKSALGLINRAQQAYRYENSRMAPSLTILGVNADTDNYTYSIVSADDNNAAITTTAQSADLKLFSSRIRQTGDLTESILCESNQTVVGGETAVLPTDISNCNANYRVVR